MTRALPLPAGEKDQRVVVQKRQDGQDAVGQHTELWVTHATERWARARPQRAREFFAAGAMQAPGSIAFDIDYWSAHGITADMRVLWQGTGYQLVAKPVNVDGGNHTLELICAEGAA